MRMKVTVIFILLILSTVGVALAGSYYDWQTGSRYNWNTDSMGNTHVRGFNMHNGSSWNTTVQPNGSMRGFDSHMNPWTYDSNTGRYYNYGTGDMRYRGKRY